MSKTENLPENLTGIQPVRFFRIPIIFSLCFELPELQSAGTNPKESVIYSRRESMTGRRDSL
jgi:hypothetical protein